MAGTCSAMSMAVAVVGAPGVFQAGTGGCLRFEVVGWDCMLGIEVARLESAVTFFVVAVVVSEVAVVLCMIGMVVERLTWDMEVIHYLALVGLAAVVVAAVVEVPVEEAVEVLRLVLEADLVVSRRLGCSTLPPPWCLLSLLALVVTLSGPPVSERSFVEVG